MTTVDLVTVRLTWVEPIRLGPVPHLLRGALGAYFPDNPLLHQHDGDRLVYRYPQVQYRWDGQGPAILGLGEGARFLAGVNWVGMELRLGDRQVTVADATCEFRRYRIGLAGRLHRYRFAAPWLPLSQENYAHYRTLTAAKQVAERDRLAVAGLLIALRGFGVDFPGRLYAAFEMRSARPYRYKGVDLLGFRGGLLANVELPDGFALGRAVSHGFGWIEADQADRSCEEETSHGSPDHG